METTNNVIEMEEMTEVTEPIVGEVIEANQNNGNTAAGFAAGVIITVGATLLTKYAIKPIAKKIAKKIADKKAKKATEREAAKVIDISDDGVVPVEINNPDNDE